MASNPSTFPQLGLEAMNNGYFMAGNIISGGGMMSADVTQFHPSMLLDQGGLGLGFGLGGAAVTVAELGAQFATNNVMLAAFANQLSAAAPARSEEMDCGFDVAGGDRATYGMIWNGASDRSGTVSALEPYLVELPDAARFHFPLETYGGGPSAPATSELSLTLCSKSSSDSVLNTADQCSSGANSRSALTELPQASFVRSRSTPAPFAAVVARSRYAAVAQEVLNDVMGCLLGGVAGVAAESGSGVDSGGAWPLGWSVDASFAVSSNRLVASSEDGGDVAGAHAGEVQRVRTNLLEMLQMLDQKYNQCLDEVQSTTAKFNTLMRQGGAGHATICAPFAHRAVSAMYHGLRRRIAGAVMAAGSRPTCWGQSSSATAGDMERSWDWESAVIQKHWVAQKARRGEQPCWRPQRGLPERSVAVLKAWMFEHFLKPYPDDHTKDVLAARSGLTRNQVSNWFINARVRIWKPMIEEMYKDLKRSSAGQQGMEMEPQQIMSRAIRSQLEDGL